MIEVFWNQWDDFNNKRGPYFGRKRIWNDDRIALGKSYEWHKMNSLPYVKEFGSIACIVCGKMLGVGAAERAWGDVKHLKRGKRSRLDIIPTEKQSIIFGAASIERARAKMKEKESTWTAEDGDFEDTLVNWGVNKDGSSC